MDFYQVSFFCPFNTSPDAPKKPEKLKVHASYEEDSHWPVTVHINDLDKGHIAPRITFHMSLNHWIDFKNSIVQCDRVITEKVLGREHYE